MNGINWGNNNFVNYVPQIQPPRMEVIRVNGENGVDMFQMGPNSSVLLLDETQPIVWLVITDGAGYKTKKPFDIAEHQAQPSPEIKSLDDRLDLIDKRLSKIEEVMRDESDA